MIYKGSFEHFPKHLVWNDANGCVIGVTLLWDDYKGFNANDIVSFIEQALGRYGFDDEVLKWTASARTTILNTTKELKNQVLIWKYNDIHKWAAMRLCLKIQTWWLS